MRHCITLQINKIDTYVHRCMSTVGGLLGAYALINRLDIFGSSQTSNLIHVVLAGAKMDFKDLFIRVVAVILYGIGTSLTVFMPYYLKWNTQYMSIGIDMLVASILPFFSGIVNPIIGLYPIFFAMAIQWNSFRSVGEHVSATIFSTNNFRQFVLGIVEYKLEKDSVKLEKAKFYGFTLLFFHSGVLIEAIAHIFLGTKSSILCFIPLLVATALLIYKRKLECIDDSLELVGSKEK